MGTFLTFVTFVAPVFLQDFVNASERDEGYKGQERPRPFLRAFGFCGNNAAALESGSRSSP